MHITPLEFSYRNTYKARMPLCIPFIIYANMSFEIYMSAVPDLRFMLFHSVK